MTDVLRINSQPVRLDRVTKLFAGARAVDEVTINAEAGKLTTLLGPSGCGKTTTLRMIGGFYEPDGGEIRIGDRVVNTVPPHARSTRTVFQSYALFPHMTVFENVAFGLRATRAPRSGIKGRVEEALELVGLAGLSQRSSGQLSGGQQQRVAFARALVTKPEVLLLDEPLSNLDAKLRVHMRAEIRKLQQDLGITTIYVTHDQEEAMSLSDHVVVMNQGKIEQQGPPHEIYEKPATGFVAGFIGTTNFVPAVVDGVNGATVTVRTLGRTMTVTAPEGRPLQAGLPVQLVIRPEHLRIGTPHAGGDTAGADLQARVSGISYLGAAASYELALADGTKVVVHDPAPYGAALYGLGAEVAVQLDTGRIYIIPD
jgi:ABC-type Fe3+/spermidine/putrescine transport system ATPase subunit